MNDRKKAVHVGTVVLETVKGHLWLSLTILAVVAGAVGAALVPPLVLGRIVDGLTAGERLTLRLPLWYLAFTALAGGLESARESALTVFGQKTTHALRSRLMEKEGRLPADELNRQEPGALVSRFVGDVDTVETLFTAGIISMAADACRILSILVVVWQCSRGLAYLPLYPVRPEADAAQSAEKPEGGEPGLRICAGDGAESPHHPHAGQGDLHGDPV